MFATLRRSLPWDSQVASGVLLVFLFACASVQLAQWGPLSGLGLSPLIVGIVIGGFYGNTLRSHLPAPWVPGILFSSKTLLRLAVVFYGFRLTFQDVAQVGVEGVADSAIMLSTTFLLGTFVGTKFLGISPRLAMLTSAGSAVCGAAAVLAVEPVVHARPHETGIAVGTVVLFGTLAMVVYPLLYRNGLLAMDAQLYGLYTGATIHEVAHVVAAGRAVSAEAANSAVITKMIRVMMLAPLLAVLGLALVRKMRSQDAASPAEASAKGGFPWFAVFFIICVGVNSLQVIPPHVVEIINILDVFALTMAMCALGMETNLDKVRKVGAKPFLLAAFLALWLAIGGYWIVSLVHHAVG